MKIVFVCHDANLTGAPKIGFELARYLSNEYEVLMIVKKGGALLDFTEYRSSFSKIINTNTSHEVSDFAFVERVKMAAGILEREKPDLLYVNSVASSEWCRAGSECPIPVVLHSHEMKSELLSLASVDIFKRDLPRYVDLLIAVSADAGIDIVDQCQVPFQKIVLSSPGIDFNAIEKLALSGAIRTPKNVNGEVMRNDKPVISMCGIASKRKGSDIFFDSAKTLPQFNFLWIGPWNITEAPDNLAFDDYRKNRLDNFYVTDEVRNPYPYFKMTDIFTLTSREDPNPLVLMEALFLCKLCIGFSDTGGGKDLLNRYGVLLHGAITADRLTTIIQKINPDSLTRFLSDERKLLFMKEYDFQVMAQQIQTQISSLLKQTVPSL